MEAATFRMSGAYDLVVIGGGPAGTSAAITARASGASVLLLERGFFPRHKVCGEFVSAESLNLLETLLGAQHKPLVNHAIRIDRTCVFLDGRAIETAIHPPAASIARLNLDAALWDSAEQCGVDALSKTMVHGVSGHGPFRVTASRGEFDARAVINASGRWSNLTADPSLGAGSAKKWLGIKGHFSEPRPRSSVDLYFFDGGYCGIQPVSLPGAADGQNRINACAMVKADVATTLHEVFDQHPQLRERTGNWVPLSDPVTTSPLLFRPPQPVRDGILMAGDAAVFVDPFIGDGISMALRGGTLAARSLLPFFQNKSSLGDAALSYQKTYRRRLVPVFKSSAMIRHVLALPRAIRVPMIFFARSAPAVTKYLVKRTRVA